MTRIGRWLIAATAAGLGCGPSASIPAGQGASPAPTTPPAAGTRDQQGEAGLLPAGFGTLRQDDIALRLNHLALQVRVLPLDESVIRLLAPDTYRSLAELRRSKRDLLDALARRTGTSTISVWYVQFFSNELGETPFTPTDLQITNVGRDFRPLDVLPLTPRFSEHRVSQRETVSALFAYDGNVDVGQPLVVSYEGAQNADWTSLLSRLERERVAVRARARGAP